MTVPNRSDATPLPDITVYAIRIRETGRVLAENFLAQSTFGAIPDNAAVFTDQDTAVVVMRHIQREIDATHVSMGFRSPCTLETFRIDRSRSDEVNAGFRIWEIDARAARCHESARQLLATKRPTYLTPVRSNLPILGPAFDAIARTVAS